MVGFYGTFFGTLKIVQNGQNPVWSCLSPPCSDAADPSHIMGMYMDHGDTIPTPILEAGRALVRNSGDLGWVNTQVSPKILIFNGLGLCHAKVLKMVHFHA